jgi:uncharacterized protein involved in outer membrane biogenesis
LAAFLFETVWLYLNITKKNIVNTHHCIIHRFTVKKLFILLAILLAIVGIFWFVLTTFVIDAPKMAQKLEAAIEQATGREVEVNQTAEISVFPLPQVTYNGLKISNIEGASTPDFLSVSKVTVKIGFGELFGGEGLPSEVILDDAVVDFEVLPGGIKNWHFKGQSSDFQKYFVNAPVTFNKALIRYLNVPTGSRNQLEDINGVLRYEENGTIVSFNGDARVHGQNSQFMARMNSVDLSSSSVPEVPFQLALKHMGATFTAQGKLSGANKDPEFIGQVKIEAPNLWGVVGMFNGEQPKTMTDSSADTNVTAEGDVRISNRHVILDGMEVSATGTNLPGLKGELNAEYTFGDAESLQAKIDFEMIDLDFLADSYSAWFAQGTEKTPATQTLKKEANDAAKEEKSIAETLEHLSGNVAISVDSVVYNGRAMSDIELQAELEPGKLLVRRGGAKMPGETTVAFAGITRNAQDGLIFDGKLEMQGSEMEQFLALFAPKGAEIPPLNLGAFVMRTNMSVSASQIRFSEFQSKIADTRMAGSVILHRTDRIGIESYLRIADINIDTLAKTAQFMLPANEGVQHRSTGEPGEDLFDVEYSNQKYSWLNTVPIDINSDFYLQNFVLLDRKGDAAKFKLKLGVGEVGVQDLQARYNSAAITGNYALRTEAGKHPQIVIDGAMSELNLVDIFPDLARARNDKEWQDYIDQQLELMLLQTYRADVKLRVNALNIRDYSFKNLDAEMVMDNNTLDVNKFDCLLWDGQMNARMRMQAGTIPAMSASFRVQNANLLRLSQTTNLLKHAAGRTALSGQFKTAGISLRSWYNNTQGEIRVQGRDISVQGFGIANLARAVPVARTVNDVERAASIATNGGVTRLDTLEGMININQGQASIPQMRFTAPEATGSVDGTVNLVEEEMDLNMQFYLLNTVDKGEEPPMLTLSITGGIDNLKKTLETRELKNYVAQSAARRALGKTR